MDFRVGLFRKHRNNQVKAISLYSTMLFTVAFVLFSIYIFCRLTCGITRSATCLIGKTALITGANSGLGYQVTLNLASRGCRVIMADISDMEQTKKNIIELTNNPNIVTKKVDLTSLQSVRELAQDVKKSEEKLHFLVNNAGIGASKQLYTKDGLNPVVQINYLSHFLLTHLLIDLLKKSAPARIVFTSSLVSFINNLTPETLNLDNRTTGFIEVAYGNSKLAMIVASDIFGEKLQSVGVTSNAVHPGVVDTPIFKKTMGQAKNIFNTLCYQVFIPFYGKDAWEGSQSIVYCIVDKELEGQSGGFYVDGIKFFKPSKAHNREFCRKIWEESIKLVKLKENELLI